MLVFLFYNGIGFSQNKLQKQLSAAHITTISINGNQIFNISISTSKTDDITVLSTLDGEYQHQFQVVVKEVNNTLNLSLEEVSLTAIQDDKRNAHKIIAATLHLKIPEKLIVHILSDIGSVQLDGVFNELHVQLLQGQCRIKGEVKKATINTLDGDIMAMTNNATVEAVSHHGSLTLDTFSESNSIWNLKSINGNITVVKLD